MDITNTKLLYKIVCARDKRYDGRFYCGVHTTRIYCRPICPAVTPKIENISFYQSAVGAENAGFRACLRCRPDLAPNSVQWNGTAAVVGRALTLISRGEADDIPLGNFAARLGISDRHLRRLFDEHVGASPIEVATSKRLHLAKQLLHQSNLSVTDVAFASGYRSIRRFNEVFKEKFRVAPSVLRRSSDRSYEKASDFICVVLPVIAPFNWSHIFGFLKNHGVEGVESFSDNRYRRSFSIENAAETATGAVEIEFEVKKNQLLVRVSISDYRYLRDAIERVRDLFDTRLNPHTHRNDLKRSDLIAVQYLKELGLRVPGAWNSFETAVCIILGQLVSVDQARFKVKKLVEQFGKKISSPVFKDCTFLFPTPKILMKSNLNGIGITKNREHAIRELSRQVFEEQIDLTRSADIENTKSKLLAIKGIGAWTVEMIAMRCLGDTNAFPATDLIIKRALDYHKNKKGDWSPWNAYIALALWKQYAAIMSRKSRTSAIIK